MALRLWCVRADSGTYTQHFVSGGYAGIGWTNLDRALNEFDSLDELKSAYRASHLDVKSNLIVGMQSGQIWRFFDEIRAGDFVVTPEVQSRWLRFGRVAPDPSYYFEAETSDGCRYQHRRRVKWSKERLDRTEFSVPFQSALRSMLTVYELTHVDEFLTSIGRRDLIEHVADTQGGQAYDAYAVVLDRILELDAGEFEVLVSSLLTAMGFEGSEVVGGPGDGGVDAKGVLQVANVAHIDLYVQAKRYAKDRTVSSNDKSVVSRHIRNVIRSGKLTRDSTVAKSATTAADGNTHQVERYNLDTILSIGSRVNAKHCSSARAVDPHRPRGRVRGLLRTDYAHQSDNL